MALHSIGIVSNGIRTAMFLCGIAPREVQMCSVFTERGGSPSLVEIGDGSVPPSWLEFS